MLSTDHILSSKLGGNITIKFCVSVSKLQLRKKPQTHAIACITQTTESKAEELLTARVMGTQKTESHWEGVCVGWGG